MVYVRKKTKKTRTVRKRRTFRRKTVFKPQSLIKVGFPRTTMVKLRYVDSFDLNAGVATLAYHSMRANSCFDPNRTGIGHQPMNFDLWSSLYNHYVVVGSKIRCVFNPSSSTLQGGWVFGCTLADDHTQTTDPTTLMEQGLTKYKIRDGVVQHSGQAAAVTCCYSAKKFYNIKNIQDNLLRLGASIVANPSEEACFNIFSGPIPGSATDQALVYVTVIIDYIVLFSEPKEQVQS